jgi:FkbM family methyltransferase
MSALWRMLFRPLANLLPVGMTLPIMAGPLKGKKWIVGAAAGAGKGLSIVMNQSEPAQVACAMKLINPGDICFDIGANVGFYTLLFSEYAKAVHAFEPLPRNLEYLNRLIEINRIDNAHVIPRAVSNVSMKGGFSEGEDHSLGRLDAAGKMTVSVTTCDQFVADSGVVPDLIKIDVEGSEHDVLTGAGNLLVSSHPAILLSVHSDRLRSDCLALLEKSGYNAITPLNAGDPRKATEFAVRFDRDVPKTVFAGIRT